MVSYHHAQQSTSRRYSLESSVHPLLPSFLISNAEQGKGGEKEVASAGGEKVAKPKWIKVNGKYYDTSEFRHPGGNIVEMFYGLDGTTGFESFHGHNAKVCC